MNIKTVILSSAVVMAAMTTNAFAAKKNAAKANKNLTAQIEAGMQKITEDAARAHVCFLADDLLEGRRAGERGSRIAKQYIISQIRQAGLKPLLGDSYEQPFEACAVQKLKRGVRFYVNADSIANIKKGVYQSMALSNVLAVLPGKKTDEYVVVGAHLDHEGVYNDVAGRRGVWTARFAILHRPFRRNVEGEGLSQLRHGGQRYKQQVSDVLLHCGSSQTGRVAQERCQ